MKRDLSDLMKALIRRSPDTKFERFAKNFRNMGVVNHYSRYGENRLRVITSKDGMNVSLVREKGHHFHIHGVTMIDHDDEEPELSFGIEYLPDEDEADD